MPDATAKCGGHRPPLHRRVWSPDIFESRGTFDELRAGTTTLPYFAKGCFCQTKPSCEFCKCLEPGRIRKHESQSDAKNEAIFDFRPRGTGQVYDCRFAIGEAEPVGETAFPRWHQGTRGIRLRSEATAGQARVLPGTVGYGRVLSDEVA
jgi:hypothetical protein